MIFNLKKSENYFLHKTISIVVLVSFMMNSVIMPPMVYGMSPVSVLNLPLPGTMVALTSTFNPAVMQGVTINPQNPLQMDFIIHPGDKDLEGKAFEDESKKLIKYFLAALTVPEDQLWVNLSPYEENRIITREFGDTEMGRDLLAQDYMLKQLSASLMYPEENLGRKFWDRVHKEVQSRYGTTEIPMNTFNKIWIVPEKAVVHRNGSSVFVVESKLKVLLEEDYVALEHNALKNENISSRDDIVSGVSSEIVREILIPAIEREVNEGETFANLRQIYHSLILAAWYKKNLKESFLGKVYVDQGKTKGIETEDKQINQKIYDQYITAFKKGVYNYIREDVDPVTNNTIPRKYFSGGVDYARLSNDIKETFSDPLLTQFDGAKRVQVNLNGIDGEGNMLNIPLPHQNEQDSAMIARLGTNQLLDYHRWGQKGANFKLLEEIQAILFPNREDSLFPMGVNLLNDEIQAIRQDPTVLLSKADEILEALEQSTGKKLGNATNPLFISVRSSPEYSMPDQLDTILNIGMTESTIQALIANGADEKLVLNAYRRFIGHFATIVMGVERSDGIDFFFHRLQAYLRLKGKQSEFDLTADEQRELIADYKERILEVKKVSFPENDPRQQLIMAIEAIARSWDNESVRAFRDLEEIPHDSGYAVIIQEMKFGNLNDRSGAGILFSRDAATGKNEITGDFMLGKQGTAVVSGKRNEEGMQILQSQFPDVYRDLENIARILERRLARVVDIEFTIENGKLYILQIRPADIKIGAERRVFEDFLKEGILDALTKVPYLERIQNRLSKRHIMKVKDNVQQHVLFQGDVASAGAIQGRLVFSVEKFEHLVAQGLPAIMAIDYSQKANFNAVLKHSDKEVGLIANFGSSRSHIGIMTNKRLIPSIINSRLEIGESHLEIDGVIINEGDVIVLDGNNVQVFQTGSEDVLEVDRNVMKIAIEDDNVMDNRRTFLEDGNFINKTSPLAGTYGAAEVLAMNWDERAELITPQQAATLLKDEYTVARLLELNWIAWHEFLEAEAAEAKNPGDELLHIETDTKTQRKTFLHELLTLRGYINGLPEGRTDAMQEEYISGEKIHRYNSEVVFERRVPAVEWESADSVVREEILREIRELKITNPSLVLDLRKTRNSSGSIDYDVVLIKSATMEKPVDVKSIIQSKNPGLLDTPPNRLGIPVSPRIEYDEDMRFRFLLGDYQVRNDSGAIVVVNDDYWSPDEMHQRRNQIEKLVAEEFGNKFRSHFQPQELRGHQRKGNGYIGYTFWFTQDVEIDEETLRKQADSFSVFDIAVDGHRDDVIDLTRKKLIELTKAIPGLHVDEMMYRYERTLGLNKIPSERRVFKIWKEYAHEADMEQLRARIKQLLYQTPAEIRNYAYLNGDVYNISFPMVRFTMTFPQDYVDDMKTLNFVFLSDVQRQATINGLNILLKKLNQNGYNLPRDDEQSQEDINIEVLNNVSGDFSPSNHRTVLRHLPFVFGLKDHASSKEYNFYKSALVISLEMLINIGVRGSINKNESDQIERALREAGYTDRDGGRSIPQILGDQAVFSEIADKIKVGLGVSGELTRNSLAAAVVKYYKTRSVGDGNDFTRAMASLVIDAMDIPEIGDDSIVPVEEIKAAGAVISSPLDVTLVWETQSDGQLKLVDSYVEAGGGPVNSAKAITNQDIPFGITALSYTDPLRKVWEGSLSKAHLKKYLAESNKGMTKVNILNIVDGEHLKVLAGRGEPISDETMSRFLLQFDRMLTASPHLEWLMLTAGGRVLYDRSHYVYGTMVEKAHDHGIDVLIDFKYTSTKKEIQSVLDVERKQPQDILSPNIREFILILEKLGLVEVNTLKRSEMSLEQIESYARTLINRYNLKGILMTRDQDGSIFIPHEGQMFVEPAIPVSVKSVTGAGDAASAGFVLALIQGKSYAQAIKEANIFGAATVTLSGSQVATKESVRPLKDSALLAVSFDEGVHAISRWIADKLKTKRDDQPLVIAINGASGSGKTTLKKIIVAALKQRGFEKDKDNIYNHHDSNRYIHYYEELWDGTETFNDMWEKDFYGHNGIVIVESVREDVPQEWHNRDNLLLVHLSAGQETRKSRLINRGSSEDLALEKAAYDDGNYNDFTNVISIINDDRIINMMFLGIQKFLYSYDQAMLGDTEEILVKEVRQVNRLINSRVFDPRSLDQMYQSAVKIAAVMEIEDIEGQRLKRLAESGGYEKGYLLFREREPGGGAILEENKKGRLLRDGTLQPRIDNDSVSDELGDWVKANETQRAEALKDKLREEFDDIVRESERIVAGQTDRVNRLTIVLTNFMEAVRALQAVDQAMLNRETTWDELVKQGYSVDVKPVSVETAPEAYLAVVLKNGIPIDDSKVVYRVYPELKLIHLAMYYPHFPEKGEKEFNPGSGRALIRHLFNPEQYRGYHIIGSAFGPAQKSFLRMWDYHIDRNNPEIVGLNESAPGPNDITPLLNIGRVRDAFQSFNQSIITSESFNRLEPLQQDSLRTFLTQANIHLMVPDSAMMVDLSADPFEQKMLATQGVTHLDRHAFNQALLMSGVNTQVITNINDQTWEELRRDIERGLSVNDLLKKGYRAKLGIGSGKRMTTALQLLTKKPKQLPMPVIPIFTQHWGKASAMKAAATMMERYARIVEERTGQMPKVIWVQEDIGTDLTSLAHYVSTEQMTRINETFKRIFETVKDQYSAPYLSEKLLSNPNLIDPLTAAGLSELLGVFTSLKETSAVMSRENIIENLEEQSAINEQEGRVDYDLEFNLTLLKSLEIYPLEFHREIDGMTFATFLNLLWSDYIQLMETVAYVRENLEESRKLRRWGIELHARSNMIERDLVDFVPWLRSLAEDAVKKDPNAVIVFVRGIEHERINQLLHPEEPRPQADPTGVVDLSRAWKDGIVSRVTDEDIDREFITHLIENVGSSVGLNWEEIYRRGLKGSGVTAAAGKELRQHINRVYKEFGYPNGLIISFIWLLNRRGEDGQYLLPSVWDEFIQEHLLALRIAQYRETSTKFFKYVSEQFRSEGFRMAIVQYLISLHTSGMPLQQRQRFVEMALRDVFGNKPIDSFKISFPALFDENLVQYIGSFSEWMRRFGQSGYVSPALEITEKDISTMSQWFTDITATQEFLLPVTPRTDAAMLVDVPDMLTVNQQRLRLLPLTPALMKEHKRSLAELIGFMAKGAPIGMLESDIEDQAQNKIQYDSEMSFVVLGENGLPVGMAIAYQPKNKNLVYLSSFSVNPDFQGTAVSSWLLYKTLRAAFMRNLKTAHWETYPKMTNGEYARANGYYKRIGAHPASVKRDGSGLHMEYVQDLTTLLPSIYDHFKTKELDYAMLGNTVFHQTNDDAVIKNILLQTESDRPVLKIENGEMYELTLGEKEIVSQSTLTDEAFREIHQRNPHPVVIAGSDADLDVYLDKRIPEEATIRITQEGIFVDGVRQQTTQPVSHDLIHIGYALSKKTGQDNSYVLDVIVFQTLAGVMISPIERMMEHAYEELVIGKVENYYTEIIDGKTQALEKLDQELDIILATTGWTQEDFDRLIAMVDKLKAELKEKGFIEIRHKIGHQLAHGDLHVTRYDQQGERLEDAAMLADLPQEITIQDRTFKVAHITPALLSKHQDKFAALMTILNPKKTLVQMQERIQHLIHTSDEYTPLYSMAIMDQNGEPVGMTLANRSDHGEYLYLSTFVIDQRLQGSPLASWLLYHTFYNAHADGLDIAKWETFPTDNSEIYRRANTFYKKIGAVPVKDTPYNGFRRVEFVYNLAKGLPKILDEYDQKFTDSAIMADGEGASREQNNGLPQPVYTMSHTSYVDRIETFLNWFKQQTYLPVEDLGDSAVVDIGSSYGFGTVELAGVLAGMNPRVHVYGVDPASDLEARRRTISIPANVTFIKDDHRLKGGQRPENIKMIVSMNMFMYYDAPARRTMLQQMNEYLDEGGLVVLGVGGPGEKNRSLNFLVLKKQDGQLVPQELVFNKSFYSFSTEQSFSYWEGYFSGETAEAFHAWVSDIDPLLKEERNRVRQQLSKNGIVTWEQQEPEIFKSQQDLLRNIGFNSKTLSDGSVIVPLTQILQPAALPQDSALLADHYWTLRQTDEKLYKTHLERIQSISSGLLVEGRDLFEAMVYFAQLGEIDLGSEKVGQERDLNSLIGSLKKLSLKIRAEIDYHKNTGYSASNLDFIRMWQVLNDFIDIFENNEGLKASLDRYYRQQNAQDGIVDKISVTQDQAMLSLIHDDRAKQLLILMQEASFTIYHTGSMNVKKLIQAAQAVNPGFRHPFKETQLEQFEGEQFERMIRLVNEQIMIPRGLIIHAFKSDGTVSYLTINPGSWKEEPYLGRLSIWTASVKGTGEPISDAFSLGWFAFIDDQTREKFYRGLYQGLRRGVRTDDPNGITALYGQLFKNLNLSEQDFVQIMLNNVFLEEKIHARDAAYTAGLKGDYRTLWEKAPEILIAQTITRPEFELLQRGEGEPDRLNWLAVMEFSAKLQGVILEMEDYLRQGREDLAYFLFYDYIRNQMEFLTSHNEYNHNVALYFIDELLERRLVQDDKLLSYLNRDPAVSPARQALVLLKEIYTKHFYSEEERLQKLIEKNRDQVRLPGPDIDKAMFAQEDQLIIFDTRSLASANTAVDNAMLDELFQHLDLKVVGLTIVGVGISLPIIYRIWRDHTVRGNIRTLNQGDIDKTYRIESIHFLEKKGMVLPIAKRLQDIEPYEEEERMAAITALGNIGDIRAKDVLLAQLGKGDRITKVAHQALNKIGATKTDFEKGYMKVLTESRAEQRLLVAIDYLTANKVTAAVQPLLNHLSRSRNPDLSAKYQTSVLKLGGTPDQINAALILAVGHKDEYVRGAALQGLRQYGKSSAIQPLIKSLQNAPLEYYRQALDVLKALNASRDDFIDAHFKALESNDEKTINTALDNLVRVGITDLAQKLVTSVRNRSIRHEEPILLRVGELEDRNVVDELIQMFNSSHDNGEKVLIAQTLSRLGDLKAAGPIEAWKAMLEVSLKTLPEDVFLPEHFESEYKSEHGDVNMQYTERVLIPGQNVPNPDYLSLKKLIERLGQYIKALRDQALMAETKGKQTPDNAQLSDVGGIDLNPNNFDIEMQGNSPQIQFEFDAQELKSLNIQGFVPVIINISPITNIPLLLGVSDHGPDHQKQLTYEDESTPLDSRERFPLQKAGDLSRL